MMTPRPGAVPAAASAVPKNSGEKSDAYVFLETCIFPGHSRNHAGRRRRRKSGSNRKRMKERKMISPNIVTVQLSAGPELMWCVPSSLVFRVFTADSSQRNMLMLLLELRA